MTVRKRYAMIWFSHLMTDRVAMHLPALKHTPFVLTAPRQGRVCIAAADPLATAQGVRIGMAVADAKAFMPGLLAMEHKPETQEKLLHALGIKCLSYSPIVALAPPDGLLLDSSGCAHLWGGEAAYVKTIVARLQNKGFRVRVALADTIGAAWAVAHFGQTAPIVQSGTQRAALAPLPPRRTAYRRCHSAAAP